MKYVGRYEWKEGDCDIVSVEELIKDKSTAIFTYKVCGNDVKRIDLNKYPNTSFKDLDKKLKEVAKLCYYYGKTEEKIKVNYNNFYYDYIDVRCKVLDRESNNCNVLVIYSKENKILGRKIYNVCN